MEQIKLELSLNTTGETSSDNPAIRFARSRFGAAILLFVSLLWPFESFSQNCQLNAAPLCMDNTPCKTILDPKGNNVLACLSSAAAPAGALVTASKCWQYSASYNCVNQGTQAYNDTCAPIRNGNNCVNYTEKSVVCNTSMPPLASGACPLFDVTYTCETAPGTPYSQTTCNTSTACTDANGNPTFCTGPVAQETNKAFGNAVAGAEAARQAGVYMDYGVNPGETNTANLTIFKGEQNRCSQGMWGLAPNCCKQDGRGANVKNAIIGQQIAGAAWNAVMTAIGSEYMYDSLLTTAPDILAKGVNAIEAVYNSLQTGSTVMQALTNAGQTLTATQQLANATGNPGTLTNGMAAAGGAIGGALGGAAGSYVATKIGANTGWSGTISALGSAGGSIAGTYAGTYAGTFISHIAAGNTLAAATSAANGSVVAASATSSSTAASLVCWACLAAMLVVMIIMSFAACTPEDMQTQLKLGAPGLCHYIGTYCNTKDQWGGCITTMQSYCCFNSRLARIIQEGAKPQLPGATWGVPNAPDCSGIKVSDLPLIDFSKIDLTEFTQDITARSMPNGTDQATRVQTVAGNFMTANGFDPTATNGQLIVNGAQVPQLPHTTPVAPASVAMMACTVAFKVTGIAANGSQTGVYSVAQCNPGAVIVWSNQGNCPASPPTSMDPANVNFTSSTVDMTGNAKFTMTLPATCFAASNPPIQNYWKGIVTLQPTGTIGAIDAIWQ